MIAGFFFRLWLYVSVQISKLVQFIKSRNTPIDNFLALVDPSKRTAFIEFQIASGTTMWWNVTVCDPSGFYVASMVEGLGPPIGYVAGASQHVQDALTDIALLVGCGIHNLDYIIYSLEHRGTHWVERHDRSSYTRVLSFKF